MAAHRLLALTALPFCAAAACAAPPAKPLREPGPDAGVISFPDYLGKILRADAPVGRIALAAGVAFARVLGISSQAAADE